MPANTWRRDRVLLIASIVQIVLGLLLMVAIAVADLAFPINYLYAPLRTRVEEILVLCFGYTLPCMIPAIVGLLYYRCRRGHTRTIILGLFYVLMVLGLFGMSVVGYGMVLTALIGNTVW